ncbi:MAG: AAA family ATPase [Patescibacteria group bacterium]
MKERIPMPSVESFKAFRPDDMDRLERIEAIKAELLKSGKIPEEAKELLKQVDVEGKTQEVSEFLEVHAKQKEKIVPIEGAKEVRIGQESTPVFEPKGEKLLWDVEGEQFREQGQTMVEISFKRNDGVEIKPGGNSQGKVRFGEKDRYLPLSDYKALKKERSGYLEAVQNLSSDDPEKQESAKHYFEELKEKHPDSEWVLRALRHLNGLATEGAKDVLSRDPNFVETPHVVETMEKFTKLVNRQRERGQGIVILEGDAGTGKNKIIDHFAYLTQRPLFRFTCSAGKDEQDFKYLLEYDSKRGTYRIKSTVIEALETPGAILEFDEINTLKPEVAKILNSLFDHDRAIYLGEDKNIVKAAEEVLLVGLENPQHYMGVKPLAETIKSRARIMEVTYPPFEKERKGPNDKIEFRSDEALILRQYVPDLKDFTPEEFQMLWDAVANNKANPKVADLLTASVKEQIEDIKEVAEIANKIRGAYRAYHEGKSDEPIKFVFSLRESVECAYELPAMVITEEEKRRGMTKAKKAVQEVVLPKIPLGEERTYLATLISEL